MTRIRTISALTKGARLALGVGASLAIAGEPALAETLYDGSRSSCTTTNCGALAIGGTIFTFKSGATPVYIKPWQAMVFADAGECLRLDVVNRTGADLIMNVQSPGPEHYQTHVGSCSGCPLIKIDPAPHDGWYSVVVRTTNAVLADAFFGLRIGRYDSGNPNCGTPTPPH
jgi:hypothetical protein